MKKFNFLLAFLVFICASFAGVSAFGHERREERRAEHQEERREARQEERREVVVDAVLSEVTGLTFKEGTLETLVKDHGIERLLTLGFGKHWAPRDVALHPARKLLTHRERHFIDEIHLGGKSVKEQDFRHSEGRRHVLAIVDEMGRDILLLAAHSHLEMEEWKRAINKVILE